MMEQLQQCESVYNKGWFQEQLTSFNVHCSLNNREQGTTKATTATSAATTATATAATATTTAATAPITTTATTTAATVATAATAEKKLQPGVNKISNKNFTNFEKN